MVTETADGHTSAVSVVTAGSPHTTTVPAGGAGTAHITDTYGAVPGSLIVTKTITRPGARLHGRVAILVACGGPVDIFPFIIPAHTTGSVSRRFDGLPAGARCTVAEVVAGCTARVTAVAIGRRQRVTIRADGTTTVHITDRFAVKAVTVTRPPTVTG